MRSLCRSHRWFCHGSENICTVHVSAAVQVSGGLLIDLQDPVYSVRYVSPQCLTIYRVCPGFVSTCSDLVRPVRSVNVSIPWCVGCAWPLHARHLSPYPLICGYVEPGRPWSVRRENRYCHLKYFSSKNSNPKSLPNHPKAESLQKEQRNQLS